MPTTENKIGLNSAESIDFETAVIVFLILTPIAEGFLKAIGSDVYNKAKEKIVEILSKKKNPKVFFQFKSSHNKTDIIIKSETNDKDELNNIFDTIDKARDIAIRQLVQDELMVTVNYNNGWILESENRKNIDTEKTEEKEKIKCKQGLERISLFEAVMVGIYGNWLISFLDKITFSNQENFGILQVYQSQIFLVALAFSCLVIFFVFVIFKPEQVSPFFAGSAYAGHVVSIVVTATLEAINVTKGVDFWLFLVLGVCMYLIIYITEVYRASFSRKKLL